MFDIIIKATGMAKNLIEKKLNSEDIVVDATLGNGNDTLFLSGIVKYGKVYSFDIQKVAVDNFNIILKKNNISNVILINDGHENMDKYITDGVKAVMFNLGYLPKGNKNIVTKPETTIAALEKGLKLLLPGGLITIVAYPHEEGKKEREYILKYLKELSPKKYSIMEVSFINREEAPCLIAIEKNSSLHEDI
ncbi:SAM-dependent methyltransferase [Caloramator sp. E03]|uniref:tRNA (mnm(5)s(2)U34)-methyltransferase n=1 Tax=Caloramator sp. E03 TaxID=2576307 RepID=UPI00111010C7|nr:class I SAM-dependent methyltransferase [Caloramator sp. E03]QCX32627.1 SAM-dependent methyltransferase [Caloramator sp. E03]